MTDVNESKIQTLKGSSTKAQSVRIGHLTPGTVVRVLRRFLRDAEPEELVSAMNLAGAEYMRLRGIKGEKRNETIAYMVHDLFGSWIDHEFYKPEEDSDGG